MLSYQYRDLHYKDTTVSPPSYLYNGNPNILKDGLYIETVPRAFHYMRGLQWYQPQEWLTDHILYLRGTQIKSNMALFWKVLFKFRLRFCDMSLKFCPCSDSEVAEGHKLSNHTFTNATLYESSILKETYHMKQPPDRLSTPDSLFPFQLVIHIVWQFSFNVYFFDKQLVMKSCYKIGQRMQLSPIIAWSNITILYMAKPWHWLNID